MGKWADLIETKRDEIEMAMTQAFENALRGWKCLQDVILDEDGEVRIADKSDSKTTDGAVWYGKAVVIWTYHPWNWNDCEYTTWDEAEDDLEELIRGELDSYEPDLILDEAIRRIKGDENFHDKYVKGREKMATNEEVWTKLESKIRPLQRVLR